MGRTGTLIQRRALSMSIYSRLHFLGSYRTDCSAQILILLISPNKCSSIQCSSMATFSGILFLYNCILLPLWFPKTANNTSYIMQAQIYSEGLSKKKKKKPNEVKRVWIRRAKMLS